MIDSANKIAGGTITAISYYEGEWYGISLNNKNVVKRQAIISPNDDLWTDVTSTGGSPVKKFMINFNGDLFGLLEDQNLYQWNFRKEKWDLFYSGPFIDFDVRNAIFVVDTSYLPFTGKPSYI